MTLFTFSLSALLVIVYFAVANRMTVLLWPVRLKLAELGETLIAAPHMPPMHRVRIKHWLDSAFSVRRAWLIAAILPAGALFAMRDAISGRNIDPISDVPSDLRPNLRRFCALSVICVLGNSPIAAALVILQLLIYVVLWLPLGTLLRESLRTLDQAEKFLMHVFHGSNSDGFGAVS